MFYKVLQGILYYYIPLGIISFVLVLVVVVLVILSTNRSDSQDVRNERW